MLAKHLNHKNLTLIAKAEADFDSGRTLMCKNSIVQEYINALQTGETFASLWLVRRHSCNHVIGAAEAGQLCGKLPLRAEGSAR